MFFKRVITPLVLGFSAFSFAVAQVPSMMTTGTPASSLMAPSAPVAQPVPLSRPGFESPTLRLSPGGTSKAGDQARPPVVEGAATAPMPAGLAPAPRNEFQAFVAQVTGKDLPLFAQELFLGASFAAAQGAPVPDNYVLGPGDELAIQVTGLVEFEARLTIDRDGRVFIPKVGPVVLAGIQLASAERTLTQFIGKTYKNFTVTVSMGRLRTVEVFVVGQAKKPGRYLVSGLSSMINAIFETGGPGPNGSMRAVELRRAGQRIASVDLYRFMAFGELDPSVRLQAGDVLFYPPAGARVALVGAVNAPAVYEAKPGDTIGSVLGLSGGLPILASPQKAQLDRVNPAGAVARYVDDLALDSAGLATVFRPGDILTVFALSPEIADAVTLQGNVSQALRQRFRPGMRVADLLSDKRLLVPGTYWAALNAGLATDRYSREEVNLQYATIQRLDRDRVRTRLIAFNLEKAIRKDAIENLELMPGDLVTVYKPGDAGPETENSITISGEVLGGTRHFVWRPGFSLRDIIPSPQWLVDHYSYWQTASAKSLRNDINWEYARLTRRVVADLRTESKIFNLRSALLATQPKDYLPLEPGDSIALFTTAEVAVPVARRARLVTLSGEVAVPGEYQLREGETLPELIQRAGGLTREAYVFGTELRRESVRISQQEALDKLVQRLEAAVLSEGQARLQSAAGSKEQADLLQASQKADQLRVDNLRRLKATGRVALDLNPLSPLLPTALLDDRDVIVVPNTPSFVGVFGAVLNENSLLWKPNTRVSDALERSGISKHADIDHIVILRADGTAIPPRRSRGWVFSTVGSDVILMPGDTVFVPEREDKETAYASFIRGAKDITQILYQFGLGAAAIKTIRN